MGSRGWSTFAIISLQFFLLRRSAFLPFIRMNTMFWEKFSFGSLDRNQARLFRVFIFLFIWFVFWRLSEVRRIARHNSTSVNKFLLKIYVKGSNICSISYRDRDKQPLTAYNICLWHKRWPISCKHTHTHTQSYTYNPINHHTKLLRFMVIWLLEPRK